MAPVAARRLRLGVFADAARQPRWIVEAVANAAAGGDAVLCFVATGSGPRTAPPLLWRAYGALDERAFGEGGRWTQPADLEALVPPALRLRLEDVEDADLDVAFVVGDVDAERIAPLARHGAWRYGFGEGFDAGHDEAALAEVIGGRETIASGLRIERPGHPVRVACASWSRAYPFSPAKTRAALFGKSAEFLARALRALRSEPEAWVERGTVRPLASAPSTAIGAVSTVATLGSRVARRMAEKAWNVEEWSLAWRFGDAGSWDGTLEGFTQVHPPKGGFWADPFPFTLGDRHFIFFEELPPGGAKAHVSVIEIDREGRASAPVKVLERDYHLSYPFLVEDGGELFMVPETADHGTVEIYRCVAFPFRWKLERVLLSGLRCADATLHREGDRWWMFATAIRPGRGDINDELHLFTAESLLGEWRAHPANPVKSDIRGARPAGRLFKRGGELIRPGQLGVPVYGAGIALHRVTRLGDAGYAEEEVARILPRAAPWLGIHTLNRAGDLLVVDAFRRRARFAA